MSNCCVSGTITGRDYVGGLVGFNWNSTIQNCYSNSIVTGRNKVGGVVGTHELNGGSGALTNCYATGSVSGETNRGGLYGYNSGATGDDVITNSYFLNTMFNNSIGTSKTSEQLKLLSTFVSWDFTTPVWKVNGGYPFLAVMDSGMEGSGTVGDPYQITTVTQLAHLDGKGLTSYFKLMNDIDCSGVSFYPIGTYYAPFAGNFDGNNKTISNLVVTTPNVVGVGLFGVTSGATISNLIISTATILGGCDAGILVGKSTSSTVSGVLS